MPFTVRRTLACVALLACGCARIWPPPPAPTKPAAGIECRSVIEGEGAVWTISSIVDNEDYADSGFITRIQPRTGRTLSVEELAPISLAVGLGAVWVAADGTPYRDRIHKLNITTGLIDHTINFDEPHDIAAAYNSIWAVSRTASELYRLHPASGAVTAKIHLGHKAEGPIGWVRYLGNHLAAGADAVWVNTKGGVFRVSPKENLQVAFIPVDVGRARGIAFTAGRLWVLREYGRLSVIDPAQNEALSIRGLTGVEEVLGAGENTVWIVRRADWGPQYRLIELDLSTYQSQRELPVTYWSPSDIEAAQKRAAWLCLGGRVKGILLPT